MEVTRCDKWSFTLEEMAIGWLNVQRCLGASARARPEKRLFRTSVRQLMHTLLPFAQVVVPDHKVLDRGTLRAIVR